MPIRVPVVQTGLEASIQAAAKKAGKGMKIDMGGGAKSVEALSQPLGRITGKADQFTKSMEAANARVLAFGASVGVLSAVSRGFRELVKTTIEVEKRLTSINSILGGTTAQLDKFKKEIFDVARNTEQSFDAVSQAALELSRQGLQAEVVIERLNDSLILSRLSGLGATEAVAGLTAAINSFRREGISSAEVLNKLSAAAISAAVSEKDLIEGIKRSGSVATQAGVSFNELVGVITAVQEKTARGGAVIGNSFKTIFTRIQSIEKLKTMQNLGVQVTDAGGQVLGATKLIQNLAKTLETLPDAKKLQIAENLVGKFQIAPFLAILEDYNQKTSTAIRVTEVAANATSEAYARNTAISKTLSHAINETVVSVKELAETLGTIGVTDNLRGILDFFSNLVGNINKVLEGDTLGSKFAKGIMKGIGGVLSGPGLAIFGAIIAKLTFDLARFGIGSLKTFFGLNRAAKAQVTLQGQIASTLLGNKDIQQHILSIERSSLSAQEKRAQQTRFFTIALREQLGIMTTMQGIAARVAPGVMAGTRGRGRGAGGYIPNFNATAGYDSEQADINRGVGGAPKGARPVTMPNFNFGGGQRGTMVANTSEYIVPNFGGGGGSAIFNQNMVSSMGLPTGARKIRAAGGHIPNFARPESKNTKKHIILLVGARKKDSPAKEMFSYTDYSKKEKGEQKFVDTIGKIPEGVLTSAQETYKISTPSYSIAPGSDGDPPFDTEAISNVLSQEAGDTAVDFFKRLPGSKDILTKRQKSLEKAVTPGDVSAVSGKLFEAMVKAFLSDEEFIEVEKFAPNTILDSKVDDNIRGLFGIQGSQIGKRGAEMKVHDDMDHLESFARKVFDVLVLKKAAFGGGGKKGRDRKTATAAVIKNLSPQDRQRLFTERGNPRSGSGNSDANREANALIDAQMNMASGYIPNFAGDLESAIARESSAGLPVNQIRINQSGKLRTTDNPMGYAVTNMRDEPTGAIPNFARASTRRGLGRDPKPSVNRQGSFAELERSANLVSPALEKAAKSAYKMADTTHKASSGARELGEESEKEGKARRDLLGPIFAVQAGLSFLTSATEGAGGGMAEFTNILADSLGAATTAAFAGTAMKDFGESMAEEGGKVKGAMGAIVGGLGTMTMAVGATFAAIKLGGELMDQWSGVTDTASLAMDLVAESAKNAAFRLDGINPSGQAAIAEQAGAVLNSAVSGDRIATDVNFEGFEWFKFADGKLEKSLRESVKVAILNNIPSDKIKGELDIIAQDKFVDQNEVLRVVKAFDVMAEKGKEVVDTFLELEDLSFEGFTNEEVKSILTKGVAAISDFKVVGGKVVGGELTGEMRGATDAQFKELLSHGRGSNAVIDALRDRIVAGGGSDNQEIQNQQIFNLRKKLIEDEKKAAEEAAKKVKNLARITASVATEEIRVAVEKAKLDQRALDTIDEKILKGGLLKTLSIGETADLQLQKKETEATLKIRNLTLDTVNKIIAKSKTLTFIENQSSAVMEKVEQIRHSSVATEEDRKNVIQLTRDLIGENSKEIEAQIAPLLNSLDIEKDRLDLEKKRFKRTKNITTEIKIQTALLKARTVAESRAASELTTTEALEIREGISRREELLQRAGIGPRSGFQERQLNSRTAAEAIQNAQEEQRAVTIERETKQRNELRTLFNSAPDPVTRQRMGARLGLLPGESTGARAVQGLKGHQIGQQAEDMAEALFQPFLNKARKELEKDATFTALDKETQATLVLTKAKQAATGPTLELVGKLQDFSTASSSATSEAVRLNEAQTNNLKIAKELADAYEQLNLSQVASDYRDALIEGRAQNRFDALTSTDPTALLKFNKNDKNFADKLAALERDPNTGELVRGEGGLKELREILEKEEFGNQLIDASYEFAQNIGNAMTDAIIQGGNLGDILRGAATDFFALLSKAYMKRAVDQLVGGNDSKGGGLLRGVVGFLTGRASGGLITGGSGNKDDVPTLLTGGEFVIRKGAVEKYGTQFFEGLNTGRVGQMSKGGIFEDWQESRRTYFQGGRGGFYTPGTYGQEQMAGSQNLLDFATQSYTGGQFDQINEGAGFGSVSLEPQSAALTMFGRRNSPLFQREQQSKQEAFGLYIRQIQYEEQIKEQNKEDRKQFRNSILAAAGSAALSYGIDYLAKKLPKTPKPAGGDPDSPAAGAAPPPPVPSSASQVLTDNNYSPPSAQITAGRRPAAAPPVPLPPDTFESDTVDLDLPDSLLHRILHTHPTDGSPFRNNTNAPNRAAGGYISPTAGVDTVPSMLSGGEFVMNAAATQNIGRGNLAALNSGGGGEGGDGAIVAAINNLGNELGRNGESVINITVNSDGTQTQDSNGGEEDQNLAARLGDSVRQIIAEEQRLGGSLRRV